MRSPRSALGSLPCYHAAENDDGCVFRRRGGCSGKHADRHGGAPCRPDAEKDNDDGEEAAQRFRTLSCCADFSPEQGSAISARQTARPLPLPIFSTCQPRGMRNQTNPAAAARKITDAEQPSHAFSYLITEVIIP